MIPVLKPGKRHDFGVMQSVCLAVSVQCELVGESQLMELVEEQDGRMPEDMAAFYFVQLLRAVLFIHEKGFCHYNITAKRCMVERKTRTLKVGTGRGGRGGGKGREVNILIWVTIDHVIMFPSVKAQSFLKHHW